MTPRRRAAATSGMRRPCSSRMLLGGGAYMCVTMSPRSGIDKARHAVLQRQRRRILAAAGVSVNVDQAWSDDLATSIDGLDSIAHDVGLDRDDAAARNCDVANAVKPDRRIDDASPLDDEIAGCSLCVPHGGHHRSARAGCMENLAPIHHGIASRRLCLFSFSRIS